MAQHIEPHRLHQAREVGHLRDQHAAGSEQHAQPLQQIVQIGDAGEIAVGQQHHRLAAGSAQAPRRRWAGRGDAGSIHGFG